MKKYYNSPQSIFALVLFSFILAGCSSDDSSSSLNNSTEWTIPQNQIFDGGVGKDGIPSVDNPEFISAGDIDYMQDNDLVLGFQVGEDARAYTHRILDWHEIINDEVNGVPIAITYCPLTGTGIGWDRMIDGSISEFGVSGLLYNSNLIPYDRKTNSNWSQMANASVNGDLINSEINTHLLVETSWKTWKAMYPSSQVITRETGHTRNYDQYPYGNYRTTGQFNFPISKEDDRLFPKERVLGVLINGKAKAYQFKNFPGDSITVLTDTFENVPLVIVGSKELNFMVAFNQVSKTYTALQGQFPVVMQDQLGNQYDFFGKVVSGPDLRSTLISPNNYIGYWFTWSPFYETEIYE